MLSNARKALGVSLLLACALARAESAGIITHLSGTLVTQQPDGTSKVLAVNSAVNEGQTLETQDKTYARIKFNDGGEVVLRPNTRLSIAEYAYTQDNPAKDNVVVGLLKGGMRMVTGLLGKRSRERFRIDTMTATIGIRGTHFGALVCNGDCQAIPTVSGQPPANGLHVDVADGVVQVTNPAGQQLISAGQFGYVRNASTPPAIVPPSQGVQVTMPSNISQNNAAGRSIGKDPGSPECIAQ